MEYGSQSLLFSMAACLGRGGRGFVLQANRALPLAQTRRVDVQSVDATQEVHRCVIVEGDNGAGAVGHCCGRCLRRRVVCRGEARQREGGGVFSGGFEGVA
jgi:hypothetical protein